MTSHVVADLAGLVHGELDHSSRERVLRHLTGCQECRAEAQAERHFTSRLRGLAATAPSPADDLTARLRAVGARPDQPGATARDVARPVGGRPAGGWPVGPRPVGPQHVDPLHVDPLHVDPLHVDPRHVAAWPGGPWPVDTWGAGTLGGATPDAVRRPAAHPRTRPRVVVGGAVLVVGLGAVLAFSGAHRAPPRGPSDPGTDTFLVDDTGATGPLPLPQPVGVSSAGLSR